MPAEQVDHYIRRAADFLRGMYLMRDDPSYGNSMALLAIHSAISYADALRLGLGESNLSADDHGMSVDALRKTLAARKYKDDGGLKLLRELTSKKNLVAYGSKGFTTIKLSQIEQSSLQNGQTVSVKNFKLEDGEMTANKERQIGRAKNALMSFFEMRLSIPKIYIDATWEGWPVDVLAINRDGVGDIHAALIFARDYFPDGTLDIVHDGQQVEKMIKQFAQIPAHFKYVVAVDVYADLHSRRFGLADKHLDESFAPDGIGRIGFLRIAVPTDGDPKVEIEIKPERFRASIAKTADEYVAKHEADWEIRA